MAEPAKGGGVDRNELMQYLVPALAVGALVILVGLVLFTSGTGGAGSMSDGSDGTESDPGLRELVSGVKFRDVKEGLGEPCPAGANVTIHYTGWLTNGTVFDSSRKNGEPANFDLANLIPGWQKGIPGMKPGGIRKLVISPAMGYGSHQNKGNIPANSTLIFEVELIAARASGGPPEAGGGRNVATGSGRALSDGSNGGTDDPNLKELEGGLKYRDVKEGTGEPVKPGASITIHYTGWTVDGNVFDSSRKSGAPATFSLGGLIPGWQQGIPGMKPGGIRKLVIPASLGYGARGAGRDIPPNATLVFEIELVK
jgi:peptidylprolyl isomerase